MNRLAIYLAMMLCYCGCSTASKHHTTGTATQSASAGSHSKAFADTIPITWKQITLDHFEPLLKLEDAGDSAEFSFKLPTGPDQIRMLYFGQIQNGDEQYMPIIGQRLGRHFIAVKMAKRWGYDQWQQVSSGPQKGEIWGIFDQDQENSRDEMTLLHSLDDGQTFQVGVLRKPCKDAGFYDFVLAKNGSGRLTLALAQDCNSRIKAGLYHYRTLDGGMTWSRPQYEPDATQPAQDVPDNEQPGQEGQMSAFAR